MDAAALEGLVIRAWTSALGIPKFRADATFADEGGDSVAALKLVLELESALGHKVPFELVSAETTAALLARRLVDFEPETVPSQGDVIDYFPGFAGDEPALADLRRSLSTIGFSVLHDYPAVDSQELNGTLAALCATYANAIASRPAEQRPILIGWSFGGLIAHEVARLLGELGRPAAFLAILDTRLPLDPNAFSDAEQYERIQAATIGDLTPEQSIRLEGFSRLGSTWSGHAAATDAALHIIGFKTRRVEAERWAQAVPGIAQVHARLNHAAVLKSPRTAQLIIEGIRASLRGKKSDPQWSTSSPRMLQLNETHLLVDDDASAGLLDERWFAQEPWGVWAKWNEASLRWTMPTEIEEAVVRLDIRQLQAGSAVNPLRLRVDHDITGVAFSALNPHDVIVELAIRLRSQRTVEMTISCDRSDSPLHLGINMDDREFAFGIRALHIATREANSCLADPSGEKPELPVQFA